MVQFLNPVLTEVFRFTSGLATQSMAARAAGATALIMFDESVEALLKQAQKPDTAKTHFSELSFPD